MEWEAQAAQAVSAAPDESDVQGVRDAQDVRGEQDVQGVPDAWDDPEYRLDWAQKALGNLCH